MFLSHFDVGCGESEVLGDLIVDRPGDSHPLSLRPLRACEVVDVLALPRVLRMRTTRQSYKAAHAYYQTQL